MTEDSHGAPMHYLERDLPFYLYEGFAMGIKVRENLTEKSL